MARLNILNRGEIITEGLQLGGNPGLSTRAGIFVNIFHDELCAAYDWPFLLYEESITVDTTGTFDLSTLTKTCRAIRGIRLASEQSILTEWGEDFVDMRVRLLADADSGSTGKPTHFITDPDRSNDQVYFYPKPDASYSATIWYYYQPDEITSDATVPEIPSAAVMVNAVAAFASRFDGSNMLQILDTEVIKAVRNLRANMGPDGKQRQKVIRFDKSVHRWRTPGED